jgi:hypothetical protein
LVQINKVYYWAYKSKAYKHLNNLQWKLKEEVITKVIKMLSWKAWVHRPSGPIKEECGWSASA